MLKVLGGIFVGVVGVIVGLWLVMVFVAMADSSLAPQTLGYIVGGFIFLIAPLLVLPLIAGVGLLLGYRWARVIAVLASILFLLAFPIGTPIGLFGLWALWKERGKPSAPVNVPAAIGPLTEKVRPMAQALARPGTQFRGPDDKQGSAPLLLAIASVGLGFVVVIGLGLRISGDAAPAGLAAAFWPALVALIAVVAFWMWKFPFKKGPARIGRSSFNAEQEAYRAQRAEWLAQLRADPLRAPYADKIEAGEPWSADWIEYDLDPSATTTCEHLAPIEADMRAAGLALRLYQKGHLIARCCIDQDKLKAVYPLPEGVGYQEVPAPDRSTLDPPRARVHCSLHQTSIDVLRPEEAPSGTPWFPA